MQNCIMLGCCIFFLSLLRLVWNTWNLINIFSLTGQKEISSIFGWRFASWMSKGTEFYHCFCMSICVLCKSLMNPREGRRRLSSAFLCLCRSISRKCVLSNSLSGFQVLRSLLEGKGRVDLQSTQWAHGAYNCWTIYPELMRDPTYFVKWGGVGCLILLPLGSRWKVWPVSCPTFCTHWLVPRISFPRSNDIDKKGSFLGIFVEHSCFFFCVVVKKQNKTKYSQIIQGFLYCIFFATVPRDLVILYLSKLWENEDRSFKFFIWQCNSSKTWVSRNLEHGGSPRKYFVLSKVCLDLFQLLQCVLIH